MKNNNHFRLRIKPVALLIICVCMLTILNINNVYATNNVAIVDTIPPPPPPPPYPFKNGDKIFKVVEQMPRFPGCEDIEGSNGEKKSCASDKMVEFIYDNVNYPIEAKKEKFWGTAVVQFIVDLDGTLTKIKLLRDPGKGLGAAAVDVVELMNHMESKWIPGKQRGMVVKVLYTLPIKFNLE